MEYCTAMYSVQKMRTRGLYDADPERGRRMKAKGWSEQQRAATVVEDLLKSSRHPPSAHILRSICVPISFRWSLCLSFFGLNRLSKFQRRVGLSFFSAAQQTSSDFTLRHPTPVRLRRGSSCTIHSYVIR